MTWEQWFGDTASPWINATLSQSLAYFVVDTAIIAAVPQVPVSLATLAHHLGMLTVLGMALLTRTGLPILFFFFVEEASTILLNARWFSGKKKAWTAAFVITFVLVRMLGGSIIAAEVLIGIFHIQHVTPYIVAMVLLMLASRILNLYWFATICRLCFCDPRAAKHPR